MNPRRLHPNSTRNCPRPTLVSLETLSVLGRVFTDSRFMALLPGAPKKPHITSCTCACPSLHLSHLSRVVFTLGAVGTRWTCAAPSTIHRHEPVSSHTQLHNQSANDCTRNKFVCPSLLFDGAHPQTFAGGPHPHQHFLRPADLDLSSRPFPAGVVSTNRRTSRKSDALSFNSSFHRSRSLAEARIALFHGLSGTIADSSGFQTLPKIPTHIVCRPAHTNTKHRKICQHVHGNELHSGRGLLGQQRRT